MPTLPDHMSFPPVFSGVRVTRSLVLCVCFMDRCLSFCSLPLAIVLSVLLQYTDADCSFGIFKFFLSYIVSQNAACKKSLKIPEVIRIRISKKNRRSTKHTHKTKYQVLRTPLKTGGELRCTGSVGSSCSTSDIRCATLEHKS